MTGQEEVLNQAEVLALMDGDHGLLVEIVNIFLEDYPRLVRNAHQALAAGDAKTLERVAHTLKGSASNFGAKGTCEAAHRLELLGREKDLGPAPEALAALQAQLECLRPALRELIKEGGSNESPDCRG